LVLKGNGKKEAGSEEAEEQRRRTEVSNGNA
jgi:hypothetical protein